ncbi:MAG: thioredoxin TrxC [Propionivibrio sp.]
MEDTIQLVCPHCVTINRVLPDRLQERPVCGRCKQLLLTEEPMELTTQNFDRHVNNSDLPILVDFWAPWCGPCRTMGPVIAEAARVLAPNVRVGKLNTEDESAIAARFAIRSIPTLAVFRRGTLVQQQAGAVPLPQLLAWVRAAVPGAGRGHA